jgi:hypothetical protein
MMFASFCTNQMHVQNSVQRPAHVVAIFRAAEVLLQLAGCAIRAPVLWRIAAIA